MMVSRRLRTAAGLETVLFAPGLFRFRLRFVFRRRSLLETLQHAYSRPRALQLNVPLLQLKHECECFILSPVNEKNITILVVIMFIPENVL